MASAPATASRSSAAASSQIADASRGIEAEEYDACKKANIAPVEVQVGIDGLTVVANPDLAIPDDCISTANLKKLLAPKSKIANYSELGAGFPDQQVAFFTPGTESGTYDFFTETVLETDAEQRTGSEVQTSADDNQIVTGIEGTKGALGYVGFAFADANKDKLKIARRRRRRRLRQAGDRDDRRRQLHAALASAVHVPDDRDRGQARRSRGSSSSSWTTTSRSTRRRTTCRSPTSC